MPAPGTGAGGERQRRDAVSAVVPAGDSAQAGHANGDTRELSALSPLALSGFTLPNRIALAATVNNLGANRKTTDALVAFYEARAAGGTGLIVTEGMSVHETSVPNGTVPIAYERESIPGFQRIA